MRTLTLAVLLGVMSVAPAALAQHVAAPIERGETLLEVTATGEVRAVPDTATFITGIVTDGATAKAAMAANAGRAERLITAAASAAIAERDLRTSDLSVSPRYREDRNGNDSDEIIGYRARNRLTIRVRDVARAPAVVDALIDTGATDLSGPNFSFADPAPLIARARADAVRKAEQQARDYAAALGMRVARVLRVSERRASNDGGNDIIVTGSRVAAAPIRPGEQKVGGTVWIDYALTR
jgi:uncharacterized protein